MFSAIYAYSPGEGEIIFVCLDEMLDVQECTFLKNYKIGRMQYAKLSLTSASVGFQGVYHHSADPKCLIYGVDKSNVD